METGFHIIDFSSSHFGAGLPARRSGKFIQVRGPEGEFLVMAPKAMCTYHANIAERFFAARGISGSYNSKRDTYVPGSGQWVILGGGQWSLDDGLGRFELGGISMAYGRFETAGLTGRVANSLPGYEVSVK